MEQTNMTSVKYFIMKGISDDADLQVPIFLLVLLIYLITLGGNLAILQLICLNHQLHTPMYFFLGNLSILDMSSVTITLHKVLNNFVSGDNTVSFVACMTQVYIYLSLTSDGMLLLTTMSYDRYVAICIPLHYRVIMSRRTCSLLATASWLIGFLEAMPYFGLLLNIHCFRSNIINHYYCDMIPLMTLSCSDISALVILIFTEGVVLGLAPFFLTFSSYVFIIASILRISSRTGRRKAFYTCSSHLTVVILLYVTVFFQYYRPNSIDTLTSNKIFSIFSTVAVPVLNPLIYSLKNKDVKSAFTRQIVSIVLKTK